MKIRTDFVTNSSSSSYVLAYKRFPEVDSDTLAKYPFLNSIPSIIEKVLLVSTDDIRSGDVYETASDFGEYIVSNWGIASIGLDKLDAVLESEPYAKKLYEDAKPYFDRGFSVMEKTVDRNDDAFWAVLHELAEFGDYFAILREE